MAWLLVTEEEAAELAAGRVPPDVRECARQLRERSETMPERKIPTPAAAKATRP